MPTFDDLRSLERYINQKMSNALQNEVAETVKDVQAKKVKEVVYDSYTSQEPKYDRRYGNDGLADKKNMKETITNNGNTVSLEIKNVADSNPNVDYTAGTKPPDYLAGIIEYGRTRGLYSYNRTGTEYEFMQPRPFISETVKFLEQTNAHLKAMKNGLRKQGLDVE